ncbi:hypothetical protein ACFTAO_11840 [Paenibacillus rhizoplanae]
MATAIQAAMSRISRCCGVLFNGWCLALIQTSAAAGAIQVRAVAPGLASAEVVLQSVSE